MNIRLLHIITLFILAFSSFSLAYEREDHEESAGSSFAFLMNTEDAIYGMSVGDGTWLKGTPVFGDYFVRAFSNGIEDSWYSGVGMTIRIMPHWKLTPFVGAGGSYNYSLSNVTENDPVIVGTQDANELKNMGETYWGGHVEGGFRLWLRNQVGLVEVMARYTWSSLGDGHEYGLIGISTGVGF